MLKIRKIKTARKLIHLRYTIQEGTIYHLFIYIIIVPLQMQETQMMVNTILEVQPRISSGGGGKTSDEIVDELADAILQKVNVYHLDIDKADASTFKLDDKGRSVAKDLFDMMKLI